VGAVSVALPLPIRKNFTYRIPDGRTLPEPGVRVRVPFGERVLTGVVVSSLDCKPIRGARVELWQANAKGVYVRALSGTVITDRNGRFRFGSFLRRTRTASATIAKANSVPEFE